MPVEAADTAAAADQKKNRRKDEIDGHHDDTLLGVSGVWIFFRIFPTKVRTGLVGKIQLSGRVRTGLVGKIRLSGKVRTGLVGFLFLWLVGFF